MSINKIPIFSWPLIILIHIYRYTLSPLIGNQCRFHPTCSNYAEMALKSHGPIKGSWIAIKRLSRCHPWHEGGYDPVPPRTGSR